MANITTLSTTIIDPGDLAYVPYEVWLVLFAMTFIFFFHAIMAKRNTEITAVIATILAGVTAWISGYIEFSVVEAVTFADGNTTIVPASYIAHPNWLAYVMLGVFLVGIVITWKNVYEIYFQGEKKYKMKGFR